MSVQILYAKTYITIFGKSRKATLPFKGHTDVTFVIPKSQSQDNCPQEYVSLWCYRDPSLSAPIQCSDMEIDVEPKILLSTFCR